MTSPMPPQPGPPTLDERDHPVLDVLPYGALVFCLLLSLSVDEPGPHARLAALILSALSAAWMLWMYTLHPAWRRRPRVMAVFITVLIVLGALLVLDATIFGIYTFTIYFFVLRYLVWPWRLLGAAAVGLLAATSQAYGVNKDTLSGVVLYLVVVAVNVTIALAYTWSRWTSTVLDERRRHALDELSTANHKLEATLSENAGLQQQLLTQAREAGVLDERQRMAREIHDTLAQGLTGIITQLQAAEQAADDQAGWRRHFDAATRLARESLSEARRSVEALRPESLELARLSDALGEVAGRWSSLHGIPVQVTTTGTARPMPPEAEFALLRTAQEALANVARHARATRVGVTLSYMECQVALDVRDDGQGFDLKKLCAQAAGSNNANTNGHSKHQRPRQRPGRPQRRRRPPPSPRRRLRRRLRPGRHAPAHREPGRHAAGRIRAGLRHRHLGLPPARRRNRGPLMSTPEPAGEAGAPIRLLIADDHPVVRDGLSAMFARDPGFEVLGEARDGAEAVTLAQALKPDVILMDLRMPGMDGLAAITELARRGVPARVLVLTTYDTDSYVLPAIEAGATGYMLKDAPRAELLHAVRAAAQGQAVLSPAVTARLMSRVRTPGAGPLSQRELEVLELVAAGNSNREAAVRLFITEATVKTHLLNIYAKLGVGDRAAAVAEAFNRGLLTPATTERP